MYSQKDHRYIWHPFQAYAPEANQIEVLKGKAEFLYDNNEKSYIDAISSWWVNIHGHTHPYINQKIAEQLAELEHVIFSGFTHKPAIDLAEKLVQWNGGEGKIFFSDNGSTAIEIALKMAIQYRHNKRESKPVFWAFEGSYHGDTFGSMSVSERDVFTHTFRNYLFDVTFFPLPNAQNIGDILGEMQKLAARQNVGAFIYEPLVQGAGGMRMYKPELLQSILELCRNHEILTIADEVMTGFYRTGKKWASDYMAFRPDFVCMSKAITGGYLPLGATWIAPQILECFQSSEPEKTFYHGHSFTGNPISCAAANASIELLENASVQETIQELGFKLESMAADWAKNHLLSDVRCRGNILAADVKLPYEGYFYNHPVQSELKQKALDAGILLRPMGNVIYIIPPYCISDESLHKINNFVCNLTL